MGETIDAQIEELIMSDIGFADGIFPKAPPPNAPDFVKAQIKIKIDDAIAFLESKRDLGEDWIDLEVKVSRAGKWYASVDNWQEDGNENKPSSNPSPGTSSTTAEPPQEGWEDIPF